MTCRSRDLALMSRVGPVTFQTGPCRLARFQHHEMKPDFGGAPSWAVTGKVLYQRVLKSKAAQLSNLEGKPGKNCSGRRQAFCTLA
jgi:hypothetical protein